MTLDYGLPRHMRPRAPAGQPPLPGLGAPEGAAVGRTGGARRVLVVGAGARGRDIADELMHSRNGAVEVVGFVDDRLDLPRLNGLPILGRFQETVEIAQRHQVDEVILAYVPNWQEELIRRAIQSNGGRSFQIKLLPGFYDAMAGGCRIETLADIPLVRIPSEGPSAGFRFAKRCFDIVVSLFALVALGPVLAICAAAVKLTSPGSAFYCQERVGLGGRCFRIHKIRTMIVDAERGTGPILAQEYDRRITPVGRFLRKTRLDEIPQFWNVLRGEMSVIGPRPERPEFVAEFRARIPGYDHRLKVRPGITGLAQVYGDYLTSVYHKLRYDWIYMHRMSLWQELRILGLTAVTVLFRAGT